MNLDDPESVPLPEHKRDIDEATDIVGWVLFALCVLVVTLLVID